LPAASGAPSIAPAVRPKPRAPAADSRAPDVDPCVPTPGAPCL
jgi:hypothetical protein